MFLFNINVVKRRCFSHGKKAYQLTFFIIVFVIEMNTNVKQTLNKDI